MLSAQIFPKSSSGLGRDHCAGAEAGAAVIKDLLYQLLNLLMDPRLLQLGGKGERVICIFDLSGNRSIGHGWLFQFHKALNILIVNVIKEAERCAVSVAVLSLLRESVVRSVGSKVMEVSTAVTVVFFLQRDRDGEVGGAHPQVLLEALP